MGLAQAYLFTGDVTHLSALSNAGSFLLNKTSFSPSDGYLANMLDQIFGGSTYTDHLNANFYGPLAAGTYLRKGTLHSTQSYIQVIHDDRSSIPNLAAWDIGMGLVGAASCGVTGTELEDWVNGVKSEIDLLVGAIRYDVIGLAGAIYGLAFVGEDFDPTTGEHAAASNINDLADILASYQIDLGGFAWRSDYVIRNDYNETIQETAYSLLALYEVGKCNYSLNVHGASNYMTSVQLATGGWQNDEYWGGKNNEITGEAMWGIAIIEDFPVHNVTQDTWHCTIQAAIDAASTVDGDVINVTAGIYSESPNINKSLTLQSVSGRDATTIALQSGGGTYFSSLTINASSVTIDGFTIEGFDDGGAGKSSTNVYLTASSDNAIIKNNRFKVALDGTGYDDGIGILTQSSSSTMTLLVDNNLFLPITVAGRAFYINPGVLDFTFTNNNISGDFQGTGIIQAKNGLVEDNILTGSGAAGSRSRGIGTWGYPDASLYGNTIFRGNNFSNLGNAIAIYSSNNITIEENTFSNNDNGVWVTDGQPNFDPTTIAINNNSFSGSENYGVKNAIPAPTSDLNATCNWWGAADGPSGSASGSGDAVSDNVTFLPWLVTSDLNGSCIGETPFQAKSSVLTDLQDLFFTGTGDKKTDKILEKAIKHLEKSLADELWEGNYHLSSKGIKVFEEEKTAVHELMKISDLDDVSAYILALVEADRILANIAIDEAENEKDKAKAEGEMVKALAEIGKGNFDKAVEHYKQAWHQATKALKNRAKSFANSDGVEGSELVDSAIPEVFGLGENYPNPFNPTTLISYDLPEASQVTMTVYDMMGRQVKALVQEFQPAGNHSVIWNATNDNGTRMSGGIYFYQIKAGSFLQTHKMILLK